VPRKKIEFYFGPVREIYRRGRRGETRGDEENREEQKEDLTQGQKSSSILITSHESQITVEQSETQHKGAKTQRSEGEEKRYPLAKSAKDAKTGKSQFPD